MAKLDSQPGRVYRGRRRLPKLPSRRYALVVTTAIMSASMVAFASAAVLPDDPSGAERENLLSVSDPFDRSDRATRQQEFGPGFSADGYAHDVWLLPLKTYEISSQFGWRPSSGRPHWGTDLAAGYGTPIYAVHDGRVQFAGFESGYGIYAQIDHGDGINIWYAHMSERYVVTDQQVKAGQLIGRVGATGHATGPHLHFEIRARAANNEWIHHDAERFMRDHGVDLRTKQEEANGGVVS